MISIKKEFTRKVNFYYKTLKIAYLVVFVLFFSLKVLGQQWRSAYYPSNWTPPTSKNFYTDAFLQDYSYAGYQRGEKAIPEPTGQIFDVTKSPYNADKTGTNDATAAIQKAIDDAQTNNGGIVYLPTGTYKLNPGTNPQALRISKSNIILKGDGVGKTFLLNASFQMNNKSIIKVNGSASWTSIPTSKALLTADIMNPVNILSVDNPSLFTVGDLVLVRNVIGDAWITEHKEPGWLGFGSSLRGLMYCRYITAIDLTNKTITIDVPVRYALKTRDGACVFKLNGMIEEVGLMDFSIGNIQNPATSGFGENDYNTTGTAGYNSHASYVISFNSVVNGWMKNVSTYKPSSNTSGSHMLSNGVLVQFSKNVTIDSCSMSKAQYGGGGGNGYAFRAAANEVLISNSTSNFVRHGFVFSSMWCSGNVFHKCKDIETGKQCGNTGSMNTSGYGSDHHMHFSQSNLIDNTYTENSGFYAYYRPYGSDPMHRITATHTAYWNIASGGTKALCVWTQQSRYGYAIGTSGAGNAVFTKENSTGSAAITDPVDIVEGPGQGTTLVPQSLYIDQLSKRIPLTAFITSTTPTSFCQGGSVVLTASTGSSYLWRNGTTQVGNNRNLTATISGTYRVEVTNSIGKTSTSTGTTVTVYSLPIATISSTTPSTFCQGGNVVLTASTGSSYIWRQGSTQVGTSRTYTSTTAGSFTVEITNSNGCKATSGATVITVNPLPTVTISSASNSFCSGSSVLLTSSPSTAYKWLNGALQVGTASTFVATTAGSFSVEVTNTQGCKATSIPKVISVAPTISPTVTITSNSTSVCSGGNVTLTASGTNAGSVPTYTWFKNGISQITGTTYNLIPANGDAIIARVTAGGTVPTCLSATTASSNSIGLTVTGVLSPTVSITSNTTSVCSGGNVTLTASGTNSGTTPTYTWFKNGITQTTGTTYNLIPTNGDAITARVSAGGTLPTCLSSTTASSNSIGLTVTPTIIPTVTTASNQTSVCSGTGISLTVTGVNAGSTPVYAWFVNNIQVGTGVIYSYLPKAGDLVKASLTASGSCLSGNPAASNVVAITVNPLVQATVSVALSANPVCANTSVTYTATPTNGGSAPVYAWFVNGNLQAGTAATFNFIPANNDVISAKMTTGGTLGNCVSNVTATSSGIVATVNGFISTALKIAPSSSIICQGSSVSFNSTASGTGSSPVYAWYVNGIPQSSTNATFGYTPANGDIVTAYMTPGGSGITCVTGGIASAAGVNLSVQSIKTASTNILSSGSNFCAGQTASFTVSGSNLGTAPTFTWYVNNQIQSNGKVFSYSPNNGDVVRAIGNAGGTLPSCLASPSVTTVGINMVVNPLVSPSVNVIASATSVCSGTGLTFTATGTNMGTLPTYAWFVNYAFVSSGNVMNFNPSNNDQVKANVIVGGSLPACLSTSSASSNIISLAVNICPKPQVSSITGPAFVLDGSSNVSYSVPNISGDTYNWTIPTGATLVSGQGTNTIVLNFGTNVNVNLSLTQTNGNGSTQVQLNILSGIAPALGTIAGLNAVSPNQTGVIYTVPNVPNTTYLWSVPAGATITSGQSTNSISVDFGPSVAGNVSVSGTNLFGTSSSSLTISQTIPTGIINTDAAPTLSVYPNPSNESFYLESASGEIKVFNLQGDMIETKSVFGSANLGENYPAGVYFLQFSNQTSTKKTIRMVKIK